MYSLRGPLLRLHSSNPTMYFFGRRTNDWRFGMTAATSRRRTRESLLGTARSSRAAIAQPTPGQREPGRSSVVLLAMPNGRRWRSFISTRIFLEGGIAAGHGIDN